MTPQQQTGRVILLVYICLIVLVSISVIGLYVSTRGTGRLPAQVVRFALTVALCFSLYRGSPVAKWVMIVLLALGGLLALITLSIDNPLAIVVGGGMATVYLSFAVVMITSSSVDAFLAYQRGERPHRQTPPEFYD